MKSSTIKLQDTSPVIGRNSRLEIYWKENGFTDFFNKFRNGKKMPVDFKTIERLEEITKLYHLKAIGFGNWVTQEDRYNYVTALFMAFYDIDKVLQFKKNIGLNNTLSISFGARGHGAALAHFEIHTFIINITRYQDDKDYSKADRFAYTGGAGSVAHEYGHALDYYFGTFRDVSKGSLSLSGGNSTSTKLEQPSGSFRREMDIVMNSIIWKVPGKTLSPYYMRLKENHNTPYMLSRCEIFARAFEKYIQYKLKGMGIKNSFLTEPKYNPTAYLTDKEMIEVSKKMDSLIGGMRYVINGER